jgi:6-phosphogluconolactonase (cycloisomerase 2 family)
MGDGPEYGMARVCLERHGSDLDARSRRLCRLPGNPVSDGFWPLAESIQRQLGESANKDHTMRGGSTMATRRLFISLACLSLIAGLSISTVHATTASSGATLLQYAGMAQDGAGSVEGLGSAFDVAVSPDGKHVYATGYSDNAVVAFSRNATSGELSFVEMEQDGVGPVDGLHGAHSVAVAPDGLHVYATGDEDDAVVAFARNATTGELSFVEMEQDGVGGVDGLDAATSVVVSPDGDNVYVTGYGDDAIAVFDRITSTGVLSFSEMHTNGAMVSGLEGALSVAVSPDGKHVYVAGRDDDAVSIFGRDQSTGKLSYLDTVWDSDLTVDGLDGVRSVIVSPDGKHVYTASYISDAVAVFERNANTGALTFVEMHKDGVGGVDGLDVGISVAVSPDGEHVYATGNHDNAMAVFERDGESGALTFVEVHRDGVDGIDGLQGAQKIAPSPDGRHVYVTGWDDDAVAIFEWRYAIYLPLVMRN